MQNHWITLCDETSVKKNEPLKQFNQWHRFNSYFDWFDLTSRLSRCIWHVNCKESIKAIAHTLPIDLKYPPNYGWSVFVEVELEFLILYHSINYWYKTEMKYR